MGPTGGAYLDDPIPVAGQAVDRAALQANQGWLADHRSALEEWRQVMAVVGAARNYVRKEGYHRGAARTAASRGGSCPDADEPACGGAAAPIPRGDRPPPARESG